mmetsp:Transcript_2520/g.3849  ORF Transcript_2520/g.3849 Transcript_2520/m.3849 type:complete len:80 (-) Transcript_2520:73-312(-)
MENPKFTVTPKQHSGIVKVATSYEDNTANKTSMDLDLYDPPGRSVTEAIKELTGAFRELSDNVIALQKTARSIPRQKFP